MRLILAAGALLLIGACGGATVRLDEQAAREQAPGLPTTLEAPVEGRSEMDAGALLADAAATDPRSAADGALIIRTGQLELEVADVAVSVSKAHVAITALGGYVAGSEEFDQGDGRWAAIVYRVPVERWDEALAALRGLAERVARESTQAQEVTAQVVDLDARVRNLRASEAALVEIMDRAGTIEEVLSVQLQLAAVREQVEQLVAQRDQLAGRAAQGTLNVTWFTPLAAVAQAQQGWDLGREIDRAAAQTLAALQSVASGLVWLLVVAVPLLLPPLLVAVVLIVLLRRRTARPGPGDAVGPAAATGAAAE